MSYGTGDQVCEPYSEELAELALGVLTGRERVRALTHVESCQRCADELEQMSRVADTVVQAAPDVEPPVGFEVRLFEKLGVSDDSHHSDDLARRRRARVVRWGSAAVAVAAAGVGLGLALSAPSSPTPTVSAQGHSASARVVSAPLLENGRTVGHVALGGKHQPWMSMMLTDPSVQGTVNCEVVTSDGLTHHVGTFVAREGYGAWFAPLPVSPRDVRTAEVVSPSGTVIATATLG